MPVWRVVLVVVALVVGVANVASQSWGPAAAMVLVIASQVVGEWRRRRSLPREALPRER